MYATQALALVCVSVCFSVEVRPCRLARCARGHSADAGRGERGAAAPRSLSITAAVHHALDAAAAVAKRLFFDLARGGHSISCTARQRQRQQ